MLSLPENQTCPCCNGSNIINDFDIAKSSLQFVCKSCGVVLPNDRIVIKESSSADQYGRGPTSYGVIGRNQGTPHTTKDGRGKNIIYELRGAGILDDLMNHHLEGMEESNKHVQALQNSAPQVFLKGGMNPAKVSEMMRPWVKRVRAADKQAFLDREPDRIQEKEKIQLSANAVKYCKALLKKMK